MARWPQYEVVSTARGRIVCMDSVGYVDERNEITDVLVCGSHGAPCATQLAVWARPRGLVCHDAGIGKGEGGVSGLALLDEFLIPGAMVAGQSARISDGRDMYENGVISRVNRAAQRLGVEPGMRTEEGARIMLERNPPPRLPPPRQIVMHDSELGRVYALDTVKYADERIAGGVLCMGSHAADAMADYVEALGLSFAGVITNDAGMAKERSGIRGLKRLDELEIPGAAVSCDSARVGDARSTYLEGIVSAHNSAAEVAGVELGQRAVDSAENMLRYARRGSARGRIGERDEA